MLSIGSICRLTVISLSIISFSTLATPRVHCGPGPHWIDDCPGGIDRDIVAAIVQIKIPCDESEPRRIKLRGVFTAQIGAGVDHTMSYELLSLRFRGRGISLHAGIEEIGIPSEGQFTEQPDNPELANWYGEYYYEFGIRSLRTKLHNKVACVQAGALGQIPVPPPSIGLPVLPVMCLNMVELPLFDENDEEVGCLVSDFSWLFEE